MDQPKIGLIQRMHSTRLHIWQPFYVPVWITGWSEKNFLLACQICSTAIVTEAPVLDSSTLSQRLLKPMEQPFEFTGLWIKPSQLSENGRYVKIPPLL